MGKGTLQVVASRKALLEIVGGTHGTVALVETRLNDQERYRRERDTGVREVRIRSQRCKAPFPWQSNPYDGWRAPWPMAAVAQAVREKLLSGGEAARAAQGAVDAGWEPMQGCGTPQELYAAMAAQQEACNAVLAVKDGMVAAMRDALSAKESEYVHLLQDQAEVGASPLLSQACLAGCTVCRPCLLTQVHAWHCHQVLSEDT